jgi:hypothetical protein
VGYRWHERCTAQLSHSPLQHVEVALRQQGLSASILPDIQRGQGTQWLNSVVLKSLKEINKIPATFVCPPDGQHLQPAHFNIIDRYHVHELPN